ncbi:MAG: hypothetical protein AB1768_20755 [Pseudomonadota bacterium]|jgi:hypothetical protein
MSKIAAMTLAALLGASMSMAFAQSAAPTAPVTTDIRQMRGDMPDHPHDKMAPGTGRPMIQEFHEGRGDMPDHPHDRPTPPSSRPLQQAKPLPPGDMPFYPSVN